jgi:two-component system sensor histidine kinase QseC
MSLQRRLLVYLLCGAPVLWSLALWYAVDRSRHEVNELFDTELIRLARQVHIALPEGAFPSRSSPSRQPDEGEADLEDLALAVWNREGETQLVDREGAMLPFVRRASGFREITIAGNAWRTYYLQSHDGERVVAAGQRLSERNEVVGTLIIGQILPWLLALPLMVLAIYWSVRQAMKPIRRLTSEIEARSPRDGTPFDTSSVPAEVRPLVSAMNGLMIRTEDAMERERAFTSNAAHELRTPLAALAMQWERLRRAQDSNAVEQASASIDRGLSRLTRLVSQMLELSRLEQGRTLERQGIVWDDLLRTAIEDCMPLANRRRIEFECHGMEDAQRLFPFQADPATMGALLRNLVDNAARYGEEGSVVEIRVGPGQVSINNRGGPLDESVHTALGHRFRRPAGQAETGSGLGIAIALQIAALNGLELSYDDRSMPGHVEVTLRDPGPRA